MASCSPHSVSFRRFLGCVCSYRLHEAVPVLLCQYGRICLNCLSFLLKKSLYFLNLVFRVGFPRVQEAEAAAVGHGISRADCDEYAVRSFKRAADAASKGFFGLEGLEPLAAAAAGAWLLLGELGSSKSGRSMH